MRQGFFVLLFVLAFDVAAFAQDAPGGAPAGDGDGGGVEINVPDEGGIWEPDPQAP